MANISGAHLAGYTPGLSNPRRVIGRIGDIMRNPNPNYAGIAEDLDLSVDSLTTLYIPYSSWQERANSKSFGKK